MKTEEMEAEFQKAVDVLEIAARAVEEKGKYSDTAVVATYIAACAPVTILLIIKRMREAEAKVRTH